MEPIQKATKKPKRLNTPKQNQEPAIVVDTLFNLPNVEMTFDFFLKKPANMTVEQLLEMTIPNYKELTESERVFVLINSLAPLEVTFPIETKCPKCDTTNTSPVELAKAQKTTGTSLQRFSIEVEDYYFEFERPEEVREPKVRTGAAGSNILAYSGMYMMQWLAGHNKGEQFDVTKMPLKIFMQLITKFAEKMFQVHYEVKAKCTNIACNHEYTEDLTVTTEDLVTYCNQL